MNKLLADLRDWLLSEYSLTVSRDRLDLIAAHVQEIGTAGTPGGFVELGCYRGATSAWMRANLDSLGDFLREIHVYDSFQGLPQPQEVDADHVSKGDLAASQQDVRDIHWKWGLKPPSIHPGWFEETLPGSLPPMIAFGYLDGDFYESITESLRHCLPRMAPGGLLVIDDYADIEANPRAWNGLPGVKKACDDYFGPDSPIEPVISDSDLPMGIYRHPA